MFEQVKANLFTVSGILITFVHVFVAVGFVTCWVAFQTQVLGNDPLGGARPQQAGKK
jgi:hypothetical protein